MNSMEKYMKMISLAPYNDRTEIPVFPMLMATFGSLGDVLQKDILNSKDKWIESVENTFAKIGTPDVCMATCPADTVFVMGLPARLPGRELGDNDLYQFVETVYFDTDEYEKIKEMGWHNWYAKYIMEIQNPPLTSPEQLGARYGVMGKQTGEIIGYLYSRGIVPCFEGANIPIYDMLSMIRSMAEFTYDLYDDPGPIMDIIHTYQPIDDENNIKMMKANGGQRFGMFAMRSSSTFVSPSIFEEYIWPELKASILRFHEAGIISVIHADGNWLPMLEYFTQLPKGCCHFELDGATDIFKAYDILKGSQSLRGDVPSTMFAYGTPDDVGEYCEKLIQMGMGGGFMLSSGCEVPLNAKVECVKAMMDSVKHPAAVAV